MIGSISRVELLTLSGIPGNLEVEIFVGDMPWPLPNGLRVEVRTGDLILITQARHGVHVVSSLAEMLGSAFGWSLFAGIVEDPREQAWILSPDGPFAMVVLEHRRLHLREDLARLLEVPARQLILRPAIADLDDFAYKHIRTRNVIVAALTSGARGHRHARADICFLDLRPLLLDLEWHFCPGSELSTARHLERLRHRCPEGFHVAVIDSEGSIATIGDNVEIEDGSVLTVLFRRDVAQPSDVRALPATVSVPSAHAGEAESAPTGPTSGAPREDTDEERNDADAGTGGSHRRSRNTRSQAAIVHSADIRDDRARKARLCMHQPPGGSPLRCVVPSWTAVCSLSALVMLCALAAVVASSRANCGILAAFLLALHTRHGYIGALAIVGVLIVCEPVHGMRAEPTRLSLVDLLPANRDLSCFGCGDSATGRPVAAPLRSSVGGCAEHHANPALSARGGSDVVRLRSTLLDDEGPDDDETGPFLCGEKLRTLLEVSVEQMGEDPFAAALASLDALRPRAIPSPVEGHLHPPSHLVSGDLGAEHDSAPPDEMVFDPSANLAFGSLDLTFSADQMHALFRPRFTTVSFGEGLAQVHPGLRRSLGGFIARVGYNEVIGPCCFVDGSFKDCPDALQAEIGWSCVFCEGSLATCTLLSGPLPSWSQEDLVLASAFRAECCAMVVGLWLGVARWQYQGFTVFSDCRAAIDIASGVAGTRVYRDSQCSRECLGLLPCFLWKHCSVCTRGRTHGQYW